VKTAREHGPLSYRQLDVLALLARGCSVLESAVALRVSPSTVEHERGALRSKLGAKALPHAVAIAFETKLLPLRAERRARLQMLLGELPDDEALAASRNEPPVERAGRPQAVSDTP
jgi:DNA-binding CsgD family transcriptional regulator